MLRTDFLPDSTRRLFERLQGDARLDGMVLVGGTALAIQIGHRMSEDLDFNVFGAPLPKNAISSLLSDLKRSGSSVVGTITEDRRAQFRINFGSSIDSYIQDYVIDETKVTFHSRSELERPADQIQFLQQADTIKPIGDHGFRVLGIDGLFAMKVLVTYDRVRSRDIYDLMILFREHGYSMDDAFERIAALQPPSNCNPERFKAVVTGQIPLDEDDEGFSSINLKATPSDAQRFFRELVDAYEVDLAKRIHESMAARCRG